jgi:hypothetical protein
MKIFLYTFLIISCSVLNAEERFSLDQIIAKREALLAEIYDVVKKNSGAGDPTQVRVAGLELYTFRRDTAKTLPERIRWQQQIVDMEKAEIKDAKRRVEVGVMQPLDVIRAEERALAAEQKLLELQQTQ